MSWAIKRRGGVTITTNPVNAQNRAFFADLHEAFDRLERDHPESLVVLTGADTCPQRESTPIIPAVICGLTARTTGHMWQFPVRTIVDGS